MLSQFHCICCAIEQFAIVLKVLNDLLMFSFKLFKAQSLFYPPGVSECGIIMGCQSSPTKFKGDYRKLTANERERGRIIKTLRILIGKEGGGGGGALVNFTLMSWQTNGKRVKLTQSHNVFEKKVPTQESNEISNHIIFLCFFWERNCTSVIRFHKK